MLFILNKLKEAAYVLDPCKNICKNVTKIIYKNTRNS
nr:MAG TPA: hypothetical protein [Bacteriophage sp.]